MPPNEESEDSLAVATCLRLLEESNLTAASAMSGFERLRTQLMHNTEVIQSLERRLSRLENGPDEMPEVSYSEEEILAGQAIEALYQATEELGPNASEQDLEARSVELLRIRRGMLAAEPEQPPQSDTTVWDHLLGDESD